MTYWKPNKLAAALSGISFATVHLIIDLFIKHRGETLAATLAWAAFDAAGFGLTWFALASWRATRESKTQTPSGPLAHS
jgi:hypothetical protein